MTIEKKLRTAVVGAGRMGTERAIAAERLGTQVVVICDADQGRASELAARCTDCRSVGDPMELPWRELDAVFVCTPPSSRGPVEQRALDHGVSVFVEKPLATSCDQFEKLVSPRKFDDSLVTAVGYMNRHRQSVRETRQRLTEQTILGVAANWVCGTYGVPWWSVEAESGGPINEQATHLFDLTRYLIGEVRQVYAVAGSFKNAKQSCATTCAVSLEFDNGCVGSLFYSCGSSQKGISVASFHRR